MELTEQQKKDVTMVMAFQRVDELNKLHDELNKIRWVGSDTGWDLAIEKVRNHIAEVMEEIMINNFPDNVVAVEETEKALRQLMTTNGLITSGAQGRPDTSTDDITSG